MLKQRVITAVVLLAVLLAVLTAPGVVPISLFLLLIVLLGLFEWFRLTFVWQRGVVTSGTSESSWADVLLRQEKGRRRLLAGCTLLLAVLLLGRLLLDYSYLGAFLLEAFGEDNTLLLPGTAERETVLSLLFGRLWLWATVGWLIACAYLFVARSDAPAFSPLLTVFGFLALPAAATALFAAFERGVWYLVSLLAIVWVADISAYCVGRTVGGAKLAPGISPGKTWSGAIGGASGVLILIGVLGALSDDGSTRTIASDLLRNWGWLGTMACAFVLAWLSIGGDLFESLLKRRAGRKDSSALLPGHGGVLDRIDAVLPVAPLAMLLVL